MNKKKKKKDNKVCFPLDKKVYADKMYKNTFSNDKLVKVVVKSNKIKKTNKKEKEKEEVKKMDP